MGRCETAPVAVVGQNPLPHATPEAVAQMVADQATAAPLPEAIDYDAYRAAGGYRLPAQIASGEREMESVIAALEDARLRGLGGAGFPTGRKWRIVRGFP